MLSWQRTEPDLERTLAKSVKKSEAKDTKLVALEKSPNAPAKPFFYPFYYDEATMAKYKDAYTKCAAAPCFRTRRDRSTVLPHARSRAPSYGCPHSTAPALNRANHKNSV